MHVLYELNTNIYTNYQAIQEKNMIAKEIEITSAYKRYQINV